MRWVTAILVLYLTSCANNKHSEVGKYVYVDCFNVIHVDRECPSSLIGNAKTKDERLAAMRGVDFIDTCKLTSVNDQGDDAGSYDFCPKCIDDNAYEHLEKIIKRNNNQKLFPHVSALEW